MEQILLYRDTRESILNGTDAEAWRHMLPAAREKALQAEMKAESNLHPALYPPSEDGSAILGHYKVGCATQKNWLLSLSGLLFAESVNFCDAVALPSAIQGYKLCRHGRFEAPRVQSRRLTGPPFPDPGCACLQVIRHISEGMVAFMLDRHDHAKPIMRSIARELLSSCVLRSLMTFFSPYTVNKASPSLLRYEPQGCMNCLPSVCSHGQHLHDRASRLDCCLQIILSLLKEKVAKQPLGAEDLAAAATVAVGSDPAPKVTCCSHLQHSQQAKVDILCTDECTRNHVAH